MSRNAQAAVDAEAQIIVAHELTQCSSDQGQLVPLVEAIENNLGRKPEQASDCMTGTETTAIMAKLANDYDKSPTAPKSASSSLIWARKHR